MSVGRSERPLVSVGMPVRNGDRYLRGAIDSILAQDYPNVELIISDNASTDGTPGICAEYAARDARVRYHRQTEDRGLLPNFRWVLERARGEYFTWMRRSWSG